MQLPISTAQALLAPYNMGEIFSLKHMTSGYTNLNYRVESSKGIFLLKIFLIATDEELAYELELMTLLEREAFPAAYPIADQNGNFLIQTEWGKAIVYQFIEGTEGPSNNESVAAIAHAVGKLNTIQPSPGINRPCEYTLDAFQQLVQDFRTTPYQYPEVYRHFENTVNYLASLSWPDLPKGLIHNDLFPDNTLFQGNQLNAIIDFECACVDTLLFDIGMTSYAFCLVDDVWDKKLLDTFIVAYEEARALSDLEKSLIPQYILRAAAQWNYWHLTFVVKENDVRKLDRAKFHQRRIDLMGFREENRDHYR